MAGWPAGRAVMAAAEVGLEGGGAPTGLRPDTAIQRAELIRLLKTVLRPGESWCLIDNRWFKQWKKYVGFENWDLYNVGEPNLFPGPIDNSGLFNDSETQTLKEHLIDELDYVLVPTEGWDKLANWYGCMEGQKPIVRKVVEYGLFVKHCKVEVYLLELKLCQNSDATNLVDSYFSKADTIATIEKEMRKQFNIPDGKEVRLWNKCTSNAYEQLSKLDSTIQDAGLYQGQVVLIEVKNEDGSWPRQSSLTKSCTAPSRNLATSSKAPASSCSSIAASSVIANGDSNNSYGLNCSSLGKGDSSFTYSYNSRESLQSQPGLCGLSNLGNTCFMNSALQTPRLEYPRKMSTAKKPKADSGRTFQEAWTESFGVIERSGKALCTFCNESVVCRTSSVRRHFDTNHKSVAELGATERKAFIAGKVRNYHSPTNHLTTASFQVSLCLAKHGKPLSDGDIIKTAILSASNSLFHDFPNRDKIMQRISEVPFSRNTVKDRVQRMASDVGQQLTTDLQKAACYSMCLDENTDVNNHASLAVILRYAAGDIMREELVKLVSLSERTQGIDIYNAVMEAFSSQDIRPEKVVSITSDGAPSIVGATSGFIQLFVKETKHNVIQFHCIIHQEAFCPKESSKKFEDVLKDVTKMVNFIMARALNSRQFQKLLEEVQAQYNCLLMYNNVRWLSRGRVLERFVGCLDEIRLFMNEKGQEYPQLTDMAWLTNLMFFTDFTVHFNVLNKRLQGFGRTAEMMFDDIKTFERKLEIFESDIESQQLKYFPNLKMHLENSTIFADNPTSHRKIYKEYSSIVAAAKVNFSNRFLQFRKMETTLGFLTSPDKAKFCELDLSCLHWLNLGNLEMELVEFQESSLWKNKFCDLRETFEQMERKGSTISSDTVTCISENEILKVWNSLPNNFQSMKALGIAFLTLFGSSYACEQVFSALNYIKSDTRNRLTDELTAACVALKLTNYEPRLEKLSAGIKQPKSH